VLPVWMLLLPRDYLSTFMKIGAVFLLAAGILFVLPPLQMPAVTRFVDGTGPVFAGSSFIRTSLPSLLRQRSDSLIASGTTPKMLRRETDAG